MEYPYGHSHHNRRDEDEYPPPPCDPYRHPSGHSSHHPPEVEAYPPAPYRNDPYSYGSNYLSDYLTRRPTVKVYPKINDNLALTIREGKVTLAQADPYDPCQHWIKDETFSTTVKDEQGFPSFALVNKATGQAIKHSVGASHPVQLVSFVPDQLDESILWTFSVDLGDGYRTIRMVNNIRLNVDAFKESNGRVYDGAKVGLWEWKKGDNQRWIVVPY